MLGTGPCLALLGIVAGGQQTIRGHAESAAARRPGRTDRGLVTLLSEARIVGRKRLKSIDFPTEHRRIAHSYSSRHSSAERASMTRARAGGTWPAVGERSRRAQCCAGVARRGWYRQNSALG